MAARDEASTVGLWLGGVGTLAILAYVVIHFLQTRDPVTAIVGANVALGVFLGGWTWVDADALGLPQVPWLMLVVLVPVLGGPAYLLAREIRRTSRASPEDG